MTTIEPTDFPRDRWTRPLVNVDGEMVAYQRPSSLGDCIDNRWNIELYKQRKAVQGLATDHAIYATAVALEITDTFENKKAWNKVVEAAQNAVRSSARAELGTALHKMTERVDRGEVLDLPPVFAADIAAYQAALERAGLAVLPGMIEVRCVNDELKAAGTFDRLVTDGHHSYIADLKTGDGVYPHGFAVQLAVYAHSSLYDVETGARERIGLGDLDLTKGVIIHLPAGKAECSVHWIDIAEGWEAAKKADWVRNVWQKNKGLLSNVVSIKAPAPQPEVEPPTSWLRAEQLRARIAKLTDAQQAELKAIWPKGISLKREVTAEESATVAALVDRYETTPVQGPDEGRPADPSAVKSLRARAANLDPDAQTWVTTMIREANAVGGETPSLRRFEIARALVFLARHGLTHRLADRIVAAIGAEQFDGEPLPDGTEGAYLASMDVQDAMRFAQLVDALAVGDGDPTPLTLLPAS